MTAADLQGQQKLTASHPLQATVSGMCAGRVRRVQSKAAQKTTLVFITHIRRGWPLRDVHRRPKETRQDDGTRARAHTVFCATVVRAAGRAIARVRAWPVERARLMDGADGERRRERAMSGVNAVRERVKLCVKH